MNLILGPEDDGWTQKTDLNNKVTERKESLIYRTINVSFGVVALDSENTRKEEKKRGRIDGREKE